MLKPNNYDNTSTFGEYEPIEVGGHIMTIQKVEESKSRNGREMLLIYLDTAHDDIQPGYFSKKWKSDDRAANQKRWGCIMYQLTEDDSGNCNRGLKTFITSVEESNNGFQVQWGDNFCACLKGKKVGAIFRREQYENRNGELKWSTKCFTFRSVQAILDGVETPKDKFLDRPSNSGFSGQFDSTENQDFDGDLPF